MKPQTFSHRARLEACLSGQMPDRIPVALWRHFPVDDQTPQTLAAATAHFQNTFDFDLLKVTPASSFCLKDWGAQDQWNGSSEGTRDYTHHVIQQPEDWFRLKPLSPTSGGLGAHLECLRLVRGQFNTHTPILQTIFSPMSQAKNLAGKDTLLMHMRNHPEALQAGLKVITETTLRFLEACMQIGIDGIFYAVQHAQYNLLSEEEFITFEQKDDLQILNAAQSLWFNMAHLHGENVMFDLVAQYPVASLNWHDRHTPPTLPDALQKFPGLLCGGLRRWETMVLGTPRQVQQEAQEAMQTCPPQRLMLGTGCVLPIVAPYGNIMAARRSVDV